MRVVRKIAFKYYLLLVMIMSMSCDNSAKMESFHSNGQLEVSASHKDGIPHGKVQEYYPSGKLKDVTFYEHGKREGKSISYYESGNVKSMVAYKDGLLTDTASYFYEDGTIEIEMPLYKGYKQGWIKFYDEEGKLSAMHEYFTQGKDEYLNQILIFDKQGQIMAEKSIYLTLISQTDTIQPNDRYRLTINLMNPQLENSKMEVQIGEFDENFNLAENARLDTIKGDGFQTTISIKPKRRGINQIRGRVVEYNIEYLEKGKEFWKKRETHIYFTKAFYVE